MRSRFIAAWFASAVALGGYGCSSDSTPGNATCVAGQSIACAGPDGCTGAQVCKSDGTYAACECGGLTDSGAGDSEGGPDAATDTFAADSTTPTDSIVADAGDDESETLGTISPGMLAGLVLWLDTDKGITLKGDGTLDTWADQSPNANNAQGKSGGTSGAIIIKSAIKGHDAIKLGAGTGSGGGFALSIADDPTLQFGTGPFCVIAVFSVPFFRSETYLFGKLGPTFDQGLFVTVDTNVNIVTKTAEAHAFIPKDSFHVVVVRGPASEIRIDGAATKGTTSTTDLDYVGAGITVGGIGETELHLTELIAVKGAVTDENVSGVEAYLRAKYKLTF